MIQEFEPTNKLEVSLQKAMAGEVTMEEFLPVLLESELYMPSTTIPEENLSNFSAIFFDNNDCSMAAVFTNRDLMNLYKEHIKGEVVMKGSSLLSRSAPGFGIVINPGYTLGLELEEHGIKNIVENFIINENNN
jgi:hypothetical protein